MIDVSLFLKLNLVCWRFEILSLLSFLHELVMVLNPSLLDYFSDSSSFARLLLVSLLLSLLVSLKVLDDISTIEIWLNDIDCEILLLSVVHSERMILGTRSVPMSNHLLLWNSELKFDSFGLKTT
jgi:hypothetical protein